ncbi:class I SAM-dependent methyltransferase [Desulfolucanica intricata]|uniref:class I SAM-dependent methyltransferase n=1 Tax=Desulfolucanica intricata TaxID=1285191 RepID=UPI00082B62B6|nr:SAM-dependent methyltransferase [Desulfolucanica intricata]
MNGDSQLSEIIIKTIAQEGPITFARFMEMALYYPELGYYTSNKEKIGREGDFYTSSNVHPLFSQMIARQAKDMWRSMGQPTDWQFIEYGAGKGILAREFLLELQRQFPQCFNALTYWIIEISPFFKKVQQEVLAELKLPDDKVRWAAGPEQVFGGKINGCIFSNELLDAFPVHRVKQQEHGLSEIYVDYRNNEFCETEGLLSKPELEDYFTRQNIKLSPGQSAEVNLNALYWLKKQASCLNKGFIFTIDYGLEAELLYSQSRFDGTLRCFRKHTLNDNPYQHIGEQDITSNVNFTALELWGEKAGLVNTKTITQADFLINMGILDVLEEQDDFTFDKQKLHQTLAIKQLIMPEGMGRYFKVLIQYKGLDQEPELQGLKKNHIYKVRKCLNK